VAPGEAGYRPWWEVFQVIVNDGRDLSTNPFTYFVTLLIYVPWSRLNAVALVITIGGATLFTLGLVLSIYRERLLALPERFRKREGMFRVLTWR
jgi:hypothetical protein